MTGATEKFCRAEGIACRSVIIHPNDHAGYYPGATALALKLVFSPATRKVLGAQAVGYSGVDKRIDVIATAIMAGMTVDDLTEIEHAYAPPYSSAKDPVNMAGFVAQNHLDGLVQVDQPGTNCRRPTRHAHTLLDVRTRDEFAAGTIPGALNIPIDELRNRLDELPADRPVIIFCRVGQRGYLAARILMANGHSDCANLSGGYVTWRQAAAPEVPIAEVHPSPCRWRTRHDRAAEQAGRDHHRRCLRTAVPRADHAPQAGDGATERGRGAGHHRQRPRLSTATRRPGPAPPATSCARSAATRGWSRRSSKRGAAR